MKSFSKQDIALMKYAAIVPALDDIPEGFENYAEFFRHVSEKGILHPCGEIRHYSPITLKHWHNHYRKYGFEALHPKDRSDIGKSRKLDDDLMTKIRHLKDAFPRMPSTAIYRKLKDDGDIRTGELSESTVNRFVNQLDVIDKSKNIQDIRRYERPHINEVWYGDSCIGPSFSENNGKKHRIIIMALMDDASRFITGIDIFFNDTFSNLLCVMKSAVSKYGRPRMFTFDNGAAYKNKQVELLCARIGSVLNHCHPYRPIGKAKLERWFRTLRDHWMATINLKDFSTLDELRESLRSYVNSYNRTIHSSLNGLSPEDRFFKESSLIKRISESDIEKFFLLEVTRRVSPDGIIKIDQKEYEVGSIYSKQKITLRYTADLSNIYLVEKDGSLSSVKLLNKHDNAKVKRKKFDFSGGDA